MVTRNIRIIILLLLFLPTFLLSQETAAEEAVDTMLEALGGKEAWATLTNTINDSQQNRLQEPVVVRSIITMDFQKPRFKIEMKADDLHIIRVINGDDHWRLTSAGEIEPIPDDFLKNDLRWYAAHVYRTLHRLAAEDEALTVKLGEDDRLNVYEDENRIVWYKLDPRGVPYAFGAWDDDEGALCGPWNRVVDGIHHPAWVSNRDGSWRAMVMELEMNAQLTDEMFERPKQ